MRLGAEMPNTAPHDTKKAKHSTVPSRGGRGAGGAGGNTVYRPNTENSVYRTVAYRVADIMLNTIHRQDTEEIKYRTVFSFSKNSYQDHPW